MREVQISEKIFTEPTTLTDQYCRSLLLIVRIDCESIGETMEKQHPSGQPVAPLGFWLLLSRLA